MKVYGPVDTLHREREATPDPSGLWWNIQSTSGSAIYQTLSDGSVCTCPHQEKAKSGQCWHKKRALFEQARMDAEGKTTERAADLLPLNGNRAFSLMR